ncbi:hypothetical protein BGX26_010870 [Mortierella sp. AD094]|nr:hypothetical protein BGX26_010870 [Mortierella sp. AD094]
MTTSTGRISYSNPTETKSGTEKKYTTPTWRHPTVEDSVDNLDISQLLTNARGGERMVVFGGTDYGLVTMSETAPLSLNKIQTHINRYHLLFAISGASVLLNNKRATLPPFTRSSTTTKIRNNLDNTSTSLPHPGGCQGGTKVESLDYGTSS